MAPIVGSIEINRSREDVFAYVEDLAKHGEWRQQIERWAARRAPLTGAAGGNRRDNTP